MTMQEQSSSPSLETTLPLPNTLPPPVQYSAETGQRIPLQFEKKGELFNVAHIFAPLDDEDYFQFDRGRNARLVDARDEKDAVEIEDESFNVAVLLWDKLITSIEGYGLTTGEGIENFDWKSRIKPQDKAFAIHGALLACEIVSLPVADSNKLLTLDDIDDTSTIRLRCLFEGHEIVTEHVLREPSAQQTREFTGLMKRRLLVRGTRFGETDQRLPSKAKGLSKLYDAACVSTSGYAGRVPAHHKVLVATEHFNSAQKTVAGK